MGQQEPGDSEQGSPSPAGGREVLGTPGGRPPAGINPAGSRGSLQSGISSALAQSDNPVKGWPGGHDTSGQLARARAVACPGLPGALPEARAGPARPAPGAGQPLMS